MNIYEQALGNITEDNWIREELFTDWGSRCLAGHVIYAQYGQDLHWHQLGDLNDQDFALVLHKVIAEQYPAAVDSWLAHPEWTTSPIGLVTFFNDCWAVYEDVRVILEKAAANERA